MTEHQLSDHLEVVACPEGQLLARNLYFETELRCGPELFELLEAHQAPARPDGARLTRSALETRLITPAHEPAGEPPYLTRLDHTLSGYLKTFMRLDQAAFDQHFGAREPTTAGWLDALARRVRAAAQAFAGFLSLQDHDRILEENAVLLAREGYTYRDPVVLCTVMFDFLWCLLERHLEPNTGGPSAALHRAALGRPQARLEYLQQPCSLHTTHQRLERMAQRCPVSPQGGDGRGGSPVGGTALFLGDDDLMSLALALRGGYRVDVIDIDPELLAFLGPHPGLATHRQDLTRGLPARFRGAYDLVASDPPYQVKPLRGFLECCRDALAPRATSRLFLSCCPPLLEDPTRLFQVLEELGLQVERADRGFNRYPTPPGVRRLGEVLTQVYRLPPGVLETVFSQPYLYASLLECSLKGVRA